MAEEKPGDKAKEKPDDDTGADITANVIRAKDVSVPISTGVTGFAGIPGEFPEDLLKIRADFLEGKEVSRRDLTRLMLRSAEGGGGGNGNCNLC